MDEKDLVLFMLATQICVILVISFLPFWMVADLVKLYRTKKQDTDALIVIHKMKVDQLLVLNHVEVVNALLEGQDKERKRIARELHDGVGNLLFSAKLHNRHKNQGIGHTEIADDKVSELLDESILEVRRISHGLKQVNFGFRDAIYRLIETVMHASDVRISFKHESFNFEEIRGYDLELYRIVQELIGNTLKHSDANKINITLSISASGGVGFTYSDNGNGFEITSIEDVEGIGLKNITERAKQMNGVVVWNRSLEDNVRCEILFK